MSPKVKEEADRARVGTKRKFSQSDKESDDYKKKRDKNNIAVRKSREKSRAKARETQEKVARLKKENEELEMKVTLLSKELILLKDLFLSHATGGGRIPEGCPRQVKVEPTVEDEVEEESEDEEVVVKEEEVEEEEVELEEDLEYVTVDISNPVYSVEISSPVNQEGLQNDHEYFSPRPPICAK